MRPLPLLAGALAAVALLAATILLLQDDQPAVGSPSAARTAVAGAAPGGASSTTLPAPLAGAGLEDVAQSPEALVRPADAVALEQVGDAVLGTVRGTLVDEDGAPVAGEPVDLLLERDPWQTRQERREGPLVLARTRSDADGRFELASRPGAEHRLLAGGLRHPRRSIEPVACGAELLVRLASPLALAGRVVDEDGGDDVEQARVLLLGPGTRLLATCNDGGAFTFTPLQDVSYTVGAWAPGRGVTTVEDVRPGDELLLALPPGRVLEGVVTDREGDEPVAGATVRLTLDVEAALLGDPDPLGSEQLVHEQEALTLEDGAFVLEEAPSRGFRLLVEAEGYVPLEVDRYRDRELEPDERLELSLQRPPVLAGRVVVHEDDRPAAGASLLVSAPGGQSWPGVADAEGRFELTLESWDGDGPVELAAVDEQGRSARHRRDRRDDDELELRLVAPVVVPVRVERDGVPVEGAAVAVLSDDAPPALGVSGPGGEVTLVAALAGPEVEAVEVQARHAGVVCLPHELEVARARPAEPVVLDLDAGVWIEGTVQDVMGQPVTEARLRVGWQGGGAFGAADPEGRFRVGPVEEGVACQLRVDAEGFRTTRLELLALEDEEVFVVLEPHVYWEGRVVDGLSGGVPEGWRGWVETEVRRGDELAWRGTRQRLLRGEGGPDTFRAQLPGPGRYRIRIEGRDVLTTFSEPTEFDGRFAPPPVELVLYPAAVLEVEVVDLVGRPVPGYGMALVQEEAAGASAAPDGRMRRSGRPLRTEDDGTARVNLGEGGSYQVAAGPRWLTSGPLLVLPGVPVQRTFRIGPTGDLSLTFRDRQGLPLLDPVVSVRAGGRDAEHYVRRRIRLRGAVDSVLVEALPPGPWQVEVRPRRGRGVSREVVVLASRLNHLHVVWDPEEAATTARSGRGRGEGGDGGKQGGGGGR